MLSRVRINEFRCLREIDVPLKPLTVLIGPNNTGKSAFLAAIDLLGKAELKPVNQSAIQPTDFWSFDSTASSKISGFTSEGMEVRVERGPISKTPQERNFWVRTGDNSTIAPINLFENSILMPAMTSVGAESKVGIPKIDNRASNLPAYLDALLRKDRKSFFRILDKLKDLIPGLIDLRIDTPSAQSRRIDLELENDLVMEAELASLGVRLLIFFVALANHPDPPNTILLEEPETGVHPKRLVDIVELLKGLTEGVFAQTKTQVILTTHSPYLLDCIDPDKHQVLVLEREPDGSRVAHPVDTERLSVFLDESMLGEVWTNQEEAGLVAKKDR